MIVAKLLWRKVDSYFNAENFRETISWCRLARHNLFQNAGDSNVAKIKRYITITIHGLWRLTLARKILLCHLNLSDPTSARRELETIPENQRSSPWMLFLTFRVAIQDDDYGLGNDYVTTQKIELIQEALESLNLLCAVSMTNEQYLLGCISEILKISNRHLAVRLLIQISGKCLEETQTGVNLPVLLR